MTARRRLLRMLLIVGLVPSVAAAGLPSTSGCGCVTALHAGPATAAASSCCGLPEGECRCGMAGEAAASCCGGSDTGPTDTGPSAECRCGGQAPAPAVPTPAPVELAAPAVLPAAFAVASVESPAVPAAERVRSARLPSSDLTTVLCTLLI